MSFETTLLIVSIFLLVSLLASKVSSRFGIPALLLFLAVGMLAGSDGPGGIYFDDPSLTQFVGIIALVLILFAGGLDTNWRDVRPIVRQGIILSTFGVLVTALLVGLFSTILLGFTLLEGMLLGAIISSTDAAAVFSILRAKDLGLKGRLRPLLEFESGSNDPMAVFLTIGLIQWLTSPGFSPWQLLVSFLLQGMIGLLLGWLFGKAISYIANHIQLSFEGLYPVLTLAMALLTYGLTSLLLGNGFLAVYLAGIVAGKEDFVHRRSLVRFHDGLAWLMQIAMFLTLGLLVYPSELIPQIIPGLLIALGLVFVARPLSVFISLLPSRFTIKEKVFISWVGLRGAVPIILATYPLLAGLEQASLIFNVVFFVVLISALLQGTSIPYVARWLGVDAKVRKKPIYPIEFTPVSGFKNELKELPIVPDSPVVGKSIVELGLPAQFLVILIARKNEFIMPSGATVLEAGDTLVVLSDEHSFLRVENQVRPE